MTEDEKKIVTYLLTGNSGTDLMTELMPHLSQEYKDSLLKDIKVYEAEFNEELNRDYDIFSHNDTVIWE